MISLQNAIFKQSPLLFLVLFLTALLPSQCHASQHSYGRFPALHFFQRQSATAGGFAPLAPSNETVTLLQQDGLTEYLYSFFYTLPVGLTADEVIFLQTSSNLNVLNITGTGNLLLSSSSRVVNVTAALSFDEMVGKTNYTLSVLNKNTYQSISSVSISFIVCGITFYVEESNGDITYGSGVGRELAIPYELLVNGTIPNSRQIKALIQDPNGHSSESYEFIKTGSDMHSSIIGPDVLFNHTAGQCTMDKLGKVVNDELHIPSECGIAYYRDEHGFLYFGVDFVPYRIGGITIHFTWPGLMAGHPTLSSEAFELSLHILVAGKPPVTVAHVVPESGLLRPEGGEIINLEVYNADFHNITSFHIEAYNVTKHFEMIANSYVIHQTPNDSQAVSFISEYGYGSLNWTLVYTVDSVVNSEMVQVYEDAVWLPTAEHMFSYDTQALRIDTISPTYGREEGGQNITITGYFPFFDPLRHGVYFSGSKLSIEHYNSVSNGTISFKLPPKSHLGESYEYYITVKMGKGVSNSILFFFLVRNAEVRVSQTGTSELDVGTYRIGSCTPARFTAVVIPYTNQILSYQWTLWRTADTMKEDLLLTTPFSYANTSAQTLELHPKLLSLDFYSLSIKVTLVGDNLETEIQLVREDVINIGAFILQPPKRAVYFPETPLRLAAVVRPPSCYTGNQSMIFEWNAFGQVQRFSSANTTGKPSEGQLTSTPARLGLEYLVPQDALSPGNHSVVFKVWMEYQESVSGQALSQVYIHRSKLVAVIRQGEEQITVNHRTFLHMYGTLSHDPDVAGNGKYTGLSYQWECRESSKQNYTNKLSDVCNPALLVNSSEPSFSVPMNILESLPSIQVLEYTLVVRKGGERVSAKQKLVIYIDQGGDLPQLNDYSVTLTNAEGKVLDLEQVPYYEQTILNLQGANDATWTYDLVAPSNPDFFSRENLINSPLFYSTESNIHSVSGNTKPLGIEAWRLDPYTRYTFQILFDRNDKHAATSVLVSFRTTEAIIVGFPVPSIINGTTETVFTATAGIPSTRSIFSYFFILTDSEGYKFCAGGCTGYDIIHFQIGRPGNYSLRAYVFDMQGKALLGSAQMAQNITVHASGTNRNYLTDLDIMFLQGDDHCWTQLAHDLALILLTPQPYQHLGQPTTPSRMIGDRSVLETHEREDLLAIRMDHISHVSKGSRKIYCSAYPNSYHGRDCISFSIDMARQRMLREGTVYNILQTVECCVQNAPFGTINKMGSLFVSFLNEANRLALNLHHGGNSRRRLLNNELSPAYVYADVQNWTVRNMFQSVTSGKHNGFTSKQEIGTHGLASFVVASNPAQLPAKVVRGDLRSFIGGPSMNEEFFPRDECLTNIFSAKEDKRLYFVFQTMENFVLLGFQDPPLRSNLADKLYQTRIFEREATGKFKEIHVAKTECCFCYRLPVLRLQEFLNGSVDDMPGIYGVSENRMFGKSVTQKGLAYNYVYKESKTSDFNSVEGWMEGCRYDTGMVGTTVVTKTAANIVVDTGGRVLGTGTLVIAGIVMGCLMLVLVAMVSSWMLAVRAMSSEGAPLGSVVANELYVERDVYGRGTIFDANAVQIGSGDQ